MKVYATTDTHFGHEKLKTMGEGRPDDYNEKMLKNFNKVQGDILIHCGDFCIGEDVKWHEEFFKATAKIKRKILVRGNHDHKSNSWYYDHAGTLYVKVRF